MKEHGKLHCHTEYSLFDGASSVKAMVKRAADMGAEAISITDHGHLMGAFPFRNACKEYGIKGILGCELNVTDELFPYVKRGHLTVYSKNEFGYKDLSMAVSATYRTKIENPVTSKEILDKYFKGKNNVYAGSACMGGVISQIILYNRFLDDKINKEKEKKKSLGYDDNVYLSIEDDINKVDLQIENLTLEKKALEPVAARKFIQREKTASKLPEPQRSISLKNINLEKIASAKAVDSLENTKKNINNLKVEKAKLNESLAAASKGKKAFDRINESIANYESLKVSDEILRNEAVNRIAEFKSIFGDDNFFIELQYHGLEHEKYVMPILYELAVETNTKIYIANDAHYDIQSQDNILKRAALSTMRYGDSYSTPGLDAGEYYIKSDEELENKLLEILPPDAVLMGFMGVEEICENCTGDVEEGTYYPAFKNVENPEESAADYIRRISEENIPLLYNEKSGKVFDENRRKAYEFELEVIISMGYADYFAITTEFCRYGKRVLNTDTLISLGPGRGSAGGCILSYTLEITDIDPFDYGLLFERFLNPERVSMPDIDIDMHPDCRALFIAHVVEIYGEDAVCQISTENRYQAKSSVKNAAKIIALKIISEGKYTKDEKKAIIKDYESVGVIIANQCGKKDGNLTDKNPETKITLADSLKKKYAGNQQYLDVINLAESIEGSPFAYGTHAAGVIVSNNSDVSEHIPLIYNKEKDSFNAQCDMNYAEQSGALKMDFLGLNTLKQISENVRLIKENKGTVVDIRKIPFETEVFKKIYGEGKTNGVFQCESDGMKNTMIMINPTCIEDIIIGISMYRPGPLDFIAQLADVKNGKTPMTFKTPLLEPILTPTYGTIVYQEQIMAIFRALAGYSIGQADIIRRAMSKKKAYILEEHRKYFVYGSAESDKTAKNPLNIPGALANGVSEKAALDIYEDMIDFAKYAFNKSHAAAYAIISYQTAYLKYHYPLEFMCALLMTTEDKEDKIFSECRGLGINILAPDVNIADETFKIVDGSIMVGFKNLKGINASAKTIVENRAALMDGFKDLKSFIYYGSNGKSEIEALIKVGAFDKLMKGYTRTSLLNIYSEYVECSNKLKEIDGLFEIEADKDKIAKLLEVKKAYELKFNSLEIPYIPEGNKYQDEKNCSGFYLSGHPVYMYEFDERKYSHIIDAKLGFCTLLACVTSITEYKTKTGEMMAFIQLDDNTEIIDCVMFPNDYKKAMPLLKEGEVFVFSGKIEYSDKYDQNQLIISSVSTGVVKKNTIVIHIDSFLDWLDYGLPFVRSFETDKGCKFLLHDRMMGEMRKGTFRIKEDIIFENEKNIKFTMISE